MERKWLQDAIRFSLKASAYTTLNDKPEPPQGRDPRLRKLEEGLLYSRQFILTYHVVVLSFVFILSSINWAQKILRWWARRSCRLRVLNVKDAYDGEAEVAEARSQGLIEGIGLDSSGSSTIEGTASPPRKVDEDEETPLLYHSHTSQPLYPRKTLFSTIISMLMYQPPPLSFINKRLPSNGCSVIILAFITLNLFYIFFHINFNLFEFFVLADRFGLVFVANLPLLYILAAKNQPLRFLTGRSYESLNIFHRRLGELLCLEAFLHAAGMVIVWYHLIRPNGYGLVRFLLLPINLLGIGAFLSYEILYLTSLASFRQRWYELFLGLHVVLQVAALVFVFFHHLSSRPYVSIALGVFLVDRLVYRLWVNSKTVEATAKILEDEETVKLSTTIILRPGISLFSFFRRSITAGWKATDHVFISVPSISNKHIIQAHPFTILSAAPTTNLQTRKLELLVRAQDGFSRDLLNATHLHRQLQIRLDGPYGSSHARDMLEDSDVALVIAGGSGIAVGWPLIQHLLYLNRPSDTEMAPTLLLQRKIILIWIIHEESHISWLGTQAITDSRNRGTEIYIPPATEDAGRPDLAMMINELAMRHAGEKGKRMRIVASGPDSMGRLVRNTCSSLVREGYGVDVAIEKFGW